MSGFAAWDFRDLGNQREGTLVELRIGPGSAHRGAEAFSVRPKPSVASAETPAAPPG